MDLRHIVSHRQKTYVEPLLINHFAGVEGTHGVDLHHGLEGVEGERAGRAQEVSSSICQQQTEGIVGN